MILLIFLRIIKRDELESKYMCTVVVGVFERFCRLRCVCYLEVGRVDRFLGSVGLLSIFVCL